jgi:hypothetical protein
MTCTRMVQKNGWWVRCDKPAQWMVMQLGKEVPRCGNHARSATEKRPVRP